MKGIKVQLLKHNKTQKELASYLDVTEQTVSRWVTGKGDPSVETLEKIAKWLDVDIFDLLGYERNR